MKKQMIMAMGVCVLAALLVGGCATGGGGPTDEEQIMSQLQAMKDAILAKNIDAIKATMSEDWYHPEVGGRDIALDYVEQGIDSGIVDDIEVDLDSVEITIEGDTATAYPIVASAPMGSVTLEFELKKEDGVWLFTGGNAEGV